MRQPRNPSRSSLTTMRISAASRGPGDLGEYGEARAIDRLQADNAADTGRARFRLLVSRLLPGLSSAAPMAEDRSPDERPLLGRDIRDRRPRMSPYRVKNAI